MSTKTLVQVGDDAKMYTVFLKNASIKHNALKLACNSLHIIRQKVQEISSVALMLQASVCTSETLSMSSPVEDRVPTGDKGMCVRGRLVLNEQGQTVVSGRAVCCSGDKEMYTGKPAVFASAVVNGVAVQVTCLISDCDAQSRFVAHFVSGDSGDNKQCVDVSALKVGRRCSNNVLWHPFQSHFLRRTTATQMHLSNFSNFGLHLHSSVHRKTAFFDILESPGDAFTCYSIFY